ncbi:hypothetical protein PG987_001793 [Apiospora arundinis]
MAQQPSELLPEEKLKLQKPQWTPRDASELVEAQKFVQDSLIPRVKSINEPTMDDFRRIATEADKEMRGSDQIRLGQASLELTPLGLERKTNIVHATLYTIGIHQDIRHGVAIAKKVFESLDDTNPSGLASSASKDLPDILQLWLQTAALDMDTYMKSYNLALDEIEAGPIGYISTAQDYFALWTWKANFDPESQEYKHHDSQKTIHTIIRSEMVRYKKDSVTAQVCRSWLEGTLWRDTESFAPKEKRAFEQHVQKMARAIWERTYEPDRYKPEGVPSLKEFSWNTCLPRVWKAIINMIFNTDTLIDRTEKEIEGAAKKLAQVLQKLPAQGDEGVPTDPQGNTYLAREDLDNLIRRLKGDIEAMRYVWCVHDSPQIRPLNILVDELFKE